VLVSAMRIVLVWAFGCVLVDGRFVFSPAREQPVSAPVTDFKGMGRSMAEELEEALPRGAGTKRLEPAMDQPKEDEKEKETRGELLAAASMFNAASSQNTEEQQAVEDGLRDAMASSSAQLGGLDRGVENTLTLGKSCLPDFAKCPKGWTQEGVLCAAGGDYSGQCAAEMDLSEMSLEQKLAFADFCGVKFPCQGACEGGQDFRYTCPRSFGARLEAAFAKHRGNMRDLVQCGSMWLACPRKRSIHGQSDVVQGGRAQRQRRIIIKMRVRKVGRCAAVWSAMHLRATTVLASRLPT